MKYPFALILAGALIAGPAIADNSPASDESVRQLLELTEAHKLIDAAKVQVNAMVTAALQDAVQGKTLTPARQAIVEQMHAKMIAMVDEMLNWEMQVMLKPMQEKIQQIQQETVLELKQAPGSS